MEGRVLGGALAQRQVNVPALPGVILRPLGHEGGHAAATLGQHLHEGLEQRGLVGGGLGVVDGDGRLDHPGAGLRMQALDGEVHALTQVEDLVVQLGMHRVAQGRVAEPVRGQGLEVAKALVAHRVGGFVEQEELVLQRGEGVEAHRLAALDHPQQGVARAHRLGLIGEFAEEQQHAVLEGNLPAAGGQDAHRRVRVGGVPAGVAGVVVELVLDVPAEHHVAEAAAVLQRREELAAVDVLAAHHPVDVEQPHLDVAEAAFLDDAPGVLDGLHIAWIEHAAPGCGSG